MFVSDVCGPEYGVVRLLYYRVTRLYYIYKLVKSFCLLYIHVLLLFIHVYF